MAATQMNVRIDENVKQQGDSVFAELGYTPSQVVRTVWSFAAQHAALPDRVTAVLAMMAGDDEALARETRAETARQGPGIVDSFRKRFGLPEPPVDDIDIDGLRLAAYQDKLQARGLA